MMYAEQVVNSQFIIDYTRHKYDIIIDIYSSKILTRGPCTKHLSEKGVRPCEQ